MNNFLAHIRKDDGKEQTIEEHLCETAALAEAFADNPFKPLARYTAIVHDIGKFRDGFQKRIRGLSASPCEHACAAAQEIHSHAFDSKLMSFFAPLLEYCTAGHHTGLQNGMITPASPQGSLQEALSRRVDDIVKYKPLYEKFCAPPDDKQLTLVYKALEKGIDKTSPDSYREFIERYAFFTRYIFSCLTDADFLDTEKFCSDGLERGISGDFAAALKKVCKKLDEMPNDTKVHRARSELQKQAFRSYSDNCVNFLNMPTGSGKTLCSIKLALESAVKNGKKRVIYVIPYTSIIEQTADTFDKLFGDVLPVLQHHSNFDYNKASESEDEAEFLARTTENWDAPLIVTTNVQFFQSIYHNRSSKLRKLHNIADSVIVFDEVHMMPIEYLQPCLRAVGYLVNFLHCEALFLSATMPDFSLMLQKYAASCGYSELISDKSGFSSFRNCRCEDLGEISEEKLLCTADLYNSSLIIVNSRKRARELYKSCTRKNRFCLSTYMTPNDRTKTFERIRSLLRNEPVTVISTSLIEAGVDLDFDAVFREISGLDSVIQSAGRCNREGRPDAGFMHIFTFEDSGVPRNLKMRANLTKSLLCEYEDIFSPECITDYYKRLYGALEQNVDGGTIYCNNMKPNCIPFRDYADSFNLIDSDSINVIIPCEENAVLVNSLEFGSGALRKLSRYSASLNYHEFTALLETGVIGKKGFGYVLNIPEYYSSETGFDPNYNINTVY